ncbi:hypothetical protein H8B09_09885 [Paenibacillus sp. PR3]|uniref:WD40 repeat domain-containing protein n=1 Tax=Paenibacillus terricola TaxID=2763503 RepID=A0ABR8MX02_9BACL|nr:WD40 repeat domain-containing protein [Paenibacillus terricola]MBD3919064.1 hypothetical protein [Paenibacillus terricola]
MSVQLLSEIQIEQFVKHRGPVTAIRQVGNTAWAVTSAYDGAVAKFNLDTGEVRLLGYHQHLVNSIVVSREGGKAASVSSDYSIGIWNMETDKQERILYGHYDDVESFVFASETVGISASRDHRILIWDLTTGAITRVLEGHEKDVLSLAYHQGYIYSSGDDKTLRVWSLDTGALLNTWGPFDVETDTCVIDLLNERVILGCDDGHIRVFSVNSGELIQDIAAHASGIKKVDVSPATGDILSAAYDQRILIWDAHSFELKRELENNPIKWERSLTFTTDGSKLLAGTFDGTVLVWDTETGALLKEVSGASDIQGNACFNDIGVLDGHQITTVSDDGYVRLIDLQNNQACKFEPASGRFLMNGLAASGQYGLVAGGAHNHRLHLFGYSDGVLIHERELALGEGPINTIRIANHPGYEQECFVGCYSGTIVRVGRDGERKGTIEVHDGAVKALRLHPTRALGASCSAAGELVTWTFEGELYRSYLGHTAIINDVDISPSGELLASVSRDFTLKVYDVERGDLVHSISLGRRSLKSVCFVDDNTIVVGDYWGHMMCVDLASGAVKRSKIAANGISTVARYGQHVLAASYDGALYVVAPMKLEVVHVYREMQQRVE